MLREVTSSVFGLSLYFHYPLSRSVWHSEGFQDVLIEWINEWMNEFTAMTLVKLQASVYTIFIIFAMYLNTTSTITFLFFNKNTLNILPSKIFAIPVLICYLYFSKRVNEIHKYWVSRTSIYVPPRILMLAMGCSHVHTSGCPAGPQPVPNWVQGSLTLSWIMRKSPNPFLI